jgi:sugar lactone lactonase YvrE
LKIEQIDTYRCTIGEGPVWDVAEQALYFIDILGKKVLRFDPSSGETRDWCQCDAGDEFGPERDGPACRWQG